MTRVRKTRILAGTALAAVLMAAASQVRAETPGGTPAASAAATGGRRARARR
ncbi:MAG: hypothetical protein ACOVOA_13170 [Allorhizobium sp.]